MERVQLILVGGFLGAGKTTLLAQAAGRLARRGRRVGLITNDQAANLVDTEILRQAGFNVSEIAGGCFCCRFENLVTSADELIASHQPDVLIGEPVGSCTDLSATVLQPLKDRYADRFRIAPFSVLVDPQRLDDLLRPPAQRSMPESVCYVYRKQIEEADLLVFNKTDLVAPADLMRLKAAVFESFPPAPMLDISALNGDGVDDWLAAVERERRAGAPARALRAGGRIAAVDYDTYAEGEARLGWLNAAVDVHAQAPVDWSRCAADLLARIQSACRDRKAEIAHVKLVLKTSGGSLVANVTGNRGAPSIRGAVAPAAGAGTLILNARANIAPDALRAIVEAAIADALGRAVQYAVTHLDHFSPARPTPVHRYDHVVE